MLSSIVQRKTAVLFKLFDQNGDGFWDKGDFDGYVDRLAGARGLSQDSAEYERLQSVFGQLWESLAAADSDSDGRVTLEEALRYQEENFTSEAVVGFAETVFQVLDVDGDGEIGPEEYRVNMAAGSIDASTADEIFTRLDVNGDGRISKDEWNQLYTEFFLSDDPDAPGNGLWGPF